MLHPIQIDTKHFRFKPRRNPGSQSQHRSVNRTAVTLMGPEIPDTRPISQGPISQRTPLNWGVVIAYGAAGIGYIIPATYLPIMAREIVQSPIVFGWSWPVFGFAAFFSTLLAARLQARFSNRQIWAVSQFVMAVGLLLPIVHPRIGAIMAAGICVGGTFMIITMVGMKEAHRIAPSEDVMRHIAVMTASFATGQMIVSVRSGRGISAGVSIRPGGF